MIAQTFRDVPGLGAHRERRVDSFVVDRHAHARRGVRKNMAVEHPDPRVVGFEGDVPSLARSHQHRVYVDRSASQAVSVLGQDREDMAVDVDRVELRAVVDNVEANQLALANAELKAQEAQLRSYLEAAAHTQFSAKKTKTVTAELTISVVLTDL